MVTNALLVAMRSSPTLVELSLPATEVDWWFIRSYMARITEDNEKLRIVGRGSMKQERLDYLATVRPTALDSAEFLTFTDHTLPDDEDDRLALQKALTELEW